MFLVDSTSLRMGSRVYVNGFLVWTKMWFGKGSKTVSNLLGWGDCIDLCQEFLLHLLTLVFHKIWSMLLKYNFILLASFYVKNWRCLPFVSKGSDESLGANTYSKNLTWVWHDFHCFFFFLLSTFLSLSFPRPTSPTTMTFGLCCNLFMPHSRNLKCTSRLKMSVSLVCFSSVAGQCTMCTRTTNSPRCLAFLRKG